MTRTHLVYINRMLSVIQPDVEGAVFSTLRNMQPQLKAKVQQTAGRSALMDYIYSCSPAVP